MEELIEIDRIIDEEPEKPMHNIFGVDPDMFPPPEKITRKQSALIVAEMLNDAALLTVKVAAQQLLSG